MFEVITSDLEQIFALSRRYEANIVSADKIAGTIILIYGRIGVDNLLLKRIISETDFLKNAMSLLHSDIARPIVMGVLCSLGHTLDIDVLKGFARYTSTILDCLESRLNDLESTERGVCVLTHSTAVVLADANPDPELSKLVSLPRVVRFFLRVVRLPNATALSFEHFLILCSLTTRFHPAVFQAIPECVDFLVACIRAQDFCVRSVALHSIRRLFPAERRSESIWDRPHSHQPAPLQYDRAIDIKRIQTLKGLRTLIDDFLENPHRSLADFGLALVDRILVNEADVRWSLMNVDPNIDTVLDAESFDRCLDDLGCTQFIEVLYLSAEAVRSSGSGSIKGDILQVEFLLASEEDDQACEFSRECVEWHSSVGFFHYVLATGRNVDDITSVRFAEKGLQCSDLTDFLREELLYSSVDYSVSLVMDMLGAGHAAVVLQWVIPLLQKSRSNAISFINDAQAESDHMSVMTALTVHLTFLLKDHTLSDDCRELHTHRIRLSQAYFIAQSSLVREFKSPWPCLAVDKIFDRMPIAWRVWKPYISRHPSRNSYPDLDPNVDFTTSRHWMNGLSVTQVELAYTVYYPKTTFISLHSMRVTYKYRYLGASSLQFTLAERGRERPHILGMLSVSDI
ncbi:hypothetical protein B0H19DRAFT_1255379 [Mycena capillaripes]|nr:hypothetical protein B0H19DRAFT_1255379 [Mycena capillaripes]